MHIWVYLDGSAIFVQKFDLKNQKNKYFQWYNMQWCGVSNIKENTQRSLSIRKVSDPKISYQGYSYRYTMNNWVDLDSSDIVVQKFDLKNQKNKHFSMILCKWGAVYAI